MSTGAWLGAWPNAESANRLAVPGGMAAEDLHVTLAYLNQPAAELGSEVRDYLGVYATRHLAWSQPVEGQVCGRATFYGRNPGRDSHVWLIDATGLDVAAACIRADHPGLLDTTHNWMPHITYGRGRLSDPRPAWEAITFDRLVLVWGEKRLTVGAS